MSVLENFAFCGIATLSLIGLYVEGKREQRKTGRLMHQYFATNYARRQAMLSSSSKVIRKGHRRTSYFQRLTQPQWLSKFFTNQM